MARKIKLKRFEIGPANHWYIKVWRFRIVVREAIGMEDGIFLFARGDPDPTSGDVRDTFETVCTAADMSYWPPNNPDPQLPHPYYRSNEVTLDFKSQTDFDWAWEQIKAAVKNLVDALNRADELIVSEDCWISETI